ncbi:hypothetical protein CWE09_01035 [Aliidiomarina minuta]|uniref:Uncharacterized protein n=1 Tax=Aliidiomarina minuta TaxID=880057 RepID=A0A432W5P3_9GAMM|nr:tetratricopeptide repeat protein [Aliidiomarina minuta]RUO25351.1 hypothetical protein CWE09_01035 [Aliidiomarina minuta]
MDRKSNWLILWFMMLLMSGCVSSAVNSRPSELRATAQQAYYAGDLITAEGLLRQALDYNDKDADSWFLLGNIYLRTQQYVAAQNAYQRAARLKPEQAEIWHNLALIHIRQATQTLLEGRRHVDDTFNPLLDWLLQVQGAAG